MKKAKMLTFEGQDVYAYTFGNAALEVTAIDFGATICAIKTKDRNGNMENVVVDFKNPQDYIDCPGPYLNAIVGPVAGRIAYGEYDLDGVTQHLSINNGLNHLHGGASGISKQRFHVEEIKGEYPKLRFTLKTQHDVDGYVGAFTYQIDYTVIDTVLQVEYACIPEKKTVLNMTSHLYFNLSGEMKESIKEHALMLPSAHKLKIHEDGFPYCVEEIVKDSTFDFSTLRNIGENFELGSEEYVLTRGYDTPFLLDKGNEILLACEKSGRRLRIKTDQKSVVVYSANYFDESMYMNEGRQAYPFCCIALETQDAPNGVNIDGLETQQIFDHEHPYHQCTQYHFSCE